MSDLSFETRSPGEMLRTAREQQGLHLAALAAAIKVTPSKLEALEADRWDELPGSTFVRALAQTVCRTLKIDAAPVLALMPPPGGVGLEPVGGGLNAPFRDRPGRDVPSLALGAMRPMVLAAAVLLLAALALIWVPERYGPGALFRPSAAPAPASGSMVSLAAASAAVPAAAVPAAAVQPASAAEGAGPGAAPGAGLFPPADAVPVLAAVPAAAEPGPSAAPAVPPAPEAASTARPSAPGLPGLLQVQTVGASWIEAHDGRGRVLLSRKVQAGERIVLDGSTPVRLVIGNAAVTRLEFRGMPVDLVPSTRDNVARIELK